MISLGSSTWGTSPTIGVSFAYEKSRSGPDMLYRVRVTVNAVTGSSYFGYPIYGAVAMEGSTKETKTIKSASPSQWSSAYTWTTGWYTISNKTSGTTSVSIRLYSGSGSSRDTTYSYTMAVDPAGSALTAPSGTLGTSTTLSITRYSASFTDTVTWVCGAYSGTIATKTSLTSLTWTPALTLANTNTTSGTVTVTYTIVTYSGNTQVQSRTTTASYAIPATVKPTATIATSDANGYLGTYGYYIQTKSALSYTVTGTGSYGSTISSYNVVFDGTTYTTASGTSSVISSTGSVSVTYFVTDSRGRASDTQTATITVTAYSAPALSGVSVIRCENDGTESPTGHYGKITFTSAITSLDNQNTADYTLQYKRTDTVNYTTDALTTYDGNYAVSGGYKIFAADDDSAFNIILTATDAFGTATFTGLIPVAYAIMNWRTDGDGMAIGKINTQAGLEIAMDSEFTGDAVFQGNVNVVDIDASSDYKLNGTSIFPISVANGGTGVTDFGTLYSASFTANSANSSGTHLTGSLTLSPGTYLLIGTVPVVSITTGAAFSIRDTGLNVINMRYVANAKQGDSIVTIATFGSATTIYMSYESSTACNFSYKERGGLQALKIS